MIRDVSKKAGISQRKAKMVIEEITSILIKSAQESEGEGVRIKGFGRFEFARRENFGSFRVSGSSDNAERAHFDDNLATYVGTLNYWPDKATLEKVGADSWILFRPVRRFRSKRAIGRLVRSR